jgi:hypothetical protein
VGFQELLSEVRHELAQHYLSRTDISAGEISWLLGFQESNSFIRAFKKLDRHHACGLPAGEGGHERPVAWSGTVTTMNQLGLVFGNGVALGQHLTPVHVERAGTVFLGK